MNLKLIEKLAKLANNNPNENEANAAARKVCQLLAEGKFNYVPTKEINDGNLIYEDLYDLINKMGRQQPATEDPFRKSWVYDPYAFGNYNSNRRKEHDWIIHPSTHERICRKCSLPITSVAFHSNNYDKHCPA